MISFAVSKFAIAKRYTRYSNYEIYFESSRSKKVRLGYKFYQKIFRRYRSKKILRINVRKPRIAVKRKTYFGRALEIKNKWSYLIGGIHKSKLARFVRLSYSKVFSCAAVLADSLESRLDILLAKTSIVPYSWIVKRFIKAGYIYVNGKPVANPGFRVRLNSRVTIFLPAYLVGFFKDIFKKKIKSRLVFWPGLPGFEISYRTFTLIKYRRVQPTEIVYPFNFDINYFFRLYPR